MNEPQTMQARTTLGFWLYLMTDCMLFASLFAVFAVLRTATANGPSGQQIFELPLVFVETILLLSSSFSCGVAVVMATRKSPRATVGLLSLTALLGVGFLTIELSEFAGLIAAHHGWETSAFLSSFFVLVGTHGLHIAIGLIWLGVVTVRILGRGITDALVQKIRLFALFWHFLDLIWVCIFTVVYLLGVAS